MKENENKYLTKAAQILAAIEDTKYKSRTAEGISKQVDLPSKAVEQLLSSDSLLRSRVMVVPGVKKDNRRLFTTVERYKKETPLAVRILNLVNKGRLK